MSVDLTLDIVRERSVSGVFAPLIREDLCTTLPKLSYLGVAGNVDAIHLETSVQGRSNFEHLSWIPEMENSSNPIHIALVKCHV